MNVSTTQVTNYATIIGVVVMILNHYHINIASDEIDTLVAGILAVGGVLMNFWHRYQRGDLKLSGARKIQS